MGAKRSKKTGDDKSIRSIAPKAGTISTIDPSVSVDKKDCYQGGGAAVLASPPEAIIDASPGVDASLLPTSTDESSHGSHLTNQEKSADLISGASNIRRSSNPKDSDRKAAKEENIPTCSSPQMSESRWIPDVYVSNFVPRAFTAVNNSTAILETTEKAECIDFTAYINTFGGLYFLSEHLSLAYPPTSSETGPLASIHSLDPENYGIHFSDCLARDMEAHSSAIRLFDLFGVSLVKSDASQKLFTLHVPGIREGVPMVSYGDEIMLRQLRLDPTTNLPFNMEAWLAPGGGAETGSIAPGFTGYQISAVVMAVQKSTETLTLKVQGWLSELLIFNVCFIVQARIIKSQQRAISKTSQELVIAHSARDSNEHNNSSKATTIGLYKDYGAIGKPVIKQPQDTQADDKINDWLRCMLFPVENDGIWQESLQSGTFSQAWVDQTLNYEQKKAVNAVQSRGYGNMPFIIHGPPGTGKTKTICETVRQLSKDQHFNGAILLCAPSDAAADTLALRLKGHFRPSEMLRLNDFSRTFAEVPQDLMTHCFVDQEIFNLPPFPTLMAYKIVICTCRAANILVQARLTNGDLASLERNMEKIIHPYLDSSSHARRSPNLHWAALFIDEAAQATEPETLIPLSVLAPPIRSEPSCRPIFAVAGDHHQLSPRTYDKASNLHISLFERLSLLDVYTGHPLSRRNLLKTTRFRLMLRPAFANLRRNYRSHPAILAVPSTLFYNDTLIPEATDIESLHSWSGWRGRRWPVLFSCNGGIDKCEDVQAAGGGGWYNVREAKKAVAYATALLSSGLIAAQHEICIMAPFDTQVRLLRAMAREQNLWGVNIGPVEAFQGLESRVVIFCTTRTRARFVSADGARGVGVMGEAKKFNVGITRARQGLIVLGNPCVLAHDECWLAFMAFCWRNGLWHRDDSSDKPAHPADSVPGPEGNVNQWAPEPSDATCGFERALLFRDRDSDGNASSAVKQFLGESETDASWRMGLEAERLVREQDGD